MNSCNARIMIRVLLCGVPLVCLINFAPACAASPATKAAVFQRDGLSPRTNDLAQAALLQALRAKEFWVKVHAAEFLIALGDTSAVEAEFSQELLQREDRRPERIGVWRVGYRLAKSDQDRAALAGEIGAVAQDKSATDRLHAIETLAKLSLQLPEGEVLAIITTTRDVGDHELAFGLWVAMNQQGNEQMRVQTEQLVSLLASDDDIARLRAAYTLWQFATHSPAPLRDAVIDAGVETAQQKAEDSLEELAGAHVIATAWKTAELWRVDDEIEEFRDARVKELSTALKQAAGHSTEVSRVLANSLAELGTPADGARLQEYLNSDDLDLRASAANALLQIEIRFFSDQQGAKADMAAQPK
ncbi:MAG: hypothetical protein ACR2NU_09750 [Aeoliella sp.]